MSQFIANVLAIVQHFAPLLASLATSFPGAFKLFEKLVSGLAVIADKLSGPFPRLKPFAAEFQAAAAFMVLHEAEILADANAFITNLPKLLQMLHDFDPAAKGLAVATALSEISQDA